jgi:hypothetical protein
LTLTSRQNISATIHIMSREQSERLASPTSSSPKTSPRESSSTTETNQISPRRGFPTGTLNVPRSPRGGNMPPISSPTDKILSPMSSLLKNKRPVGSANKEKDPHVRESPRYRGDLVSPRNFALIQSANENSVVQVVDDEESDDKDIHSTNSGGHSDDDEDANNT